MREISDDIILFLSKFLLKVICFMCLKLCLQVREISNGIDLFLRDRFRKAYALLPSLLTPPRLLPFLPALLPAPTPPLFVPGLGLVRV